jgi:hypothetical protein
MDVGPRAAGLWEILLHCSKSVDSERVFSAQCPPTPELVHASNSALCPSQHYDALRLRRENADSLSPPPSAC